MSSLHKDNPLRLIDDSNSQQLLASSDSNDVDHMNQSDETANSDDNASLSALLPSAQHKVSISDKRPETSTPIQVRLQKRNLSEIDELNPKDVENVVSAVDTDIHVPSKATNEDEVQQISRALEDGDEDVAVPPETTQVDQTVDVPMAAMGQEQSANTAIDSETEEISSRRVTIQPLTDILGDSHGDESHVIESDASETVEDVDHHQFVDRRSETTRLRSTRHLTTFYCNPKERAILDEWRHLLHDVPSEKEDPQDDHHEVDLSLDSEQKDDGFVITKIGIVLIYILEIYFVFYFFGGFIYLGFTPIFVFVSFPFISADDIKAEQDEDSPTMVIPCEMIAPMTKLRGQLTLKGNTIEFCPFDEQQSGSRGKDEINLVCFHND